MIKFPIQLIIGETGRWPEQYFKQDDQTRKDFNNDFEKDSWYKILDTRDEHEPSTCKKKSSSSSLQGKQSETGSAAPSSTTPSNQSQEKSKVLSIKMCIIKLYLRLRTASWANLD
jgi:hypothetical protein